MEPFCANCLVTVKGRKHCSSCKVMVIGDRVPMVERATKLCPEADEALKYAIIALFCLGIILGPVALSKASAARKLINADPSLLGSSQVTAATVMAIFAIGLWLLANIERFAS
ncbi:MAG TPA: hypothetical protein VMU84_08950 [Thermoanaerobaculia bacterium]|nr:hypothetical protein [Thermoanaerobaculia bacterium]